MTKSISTIAERVDTLSQQLPDSFRGGLLAALRHPDDAGQKAASFITTEVLLERTPVSSERGDVFPDHITLPSPATLTLSPQQQRIMQRHAAALSTGTGLSPRVVTDHLLLELNLLMEKGAPSAPIPLPNTTCVLTNFREQNVFQIKETFDGIIETFQNEPTIARTAASLIMHQKRYGSGVEALQAYTKAKRECLELFGAEKLTKDIAITAAGLVFEGK